MMNKSPNSTVRLPAEWEPQDAILLAWPHEESDWQPLLDEIWPLYLELARTISRFQPVLIVAPQPAKVEQQLLQAGIDLQQVRLIQLPTNDTWTRDYGPISVLHDGQPQLLDFRFNGWGNKFTAELDNRVNAGLQAAGLFRAPRQAVELVLEGGSIESDGCGTLLTTATCLLNPNRNPQLGRTEIETALRRLFGVQRFLWLQHGYLAGDDTDAHIDTLARLCPNETICYVSCDDPTDEHYPELKKMEGELRQFRTASGAAYRLIPLPWPQPCFDEAGERLPATYANYLVLNRAVLVPTYRDPADERALAAIRQAYPEREVIGIDCRAVIRQHGSLHCISMQLPQGVLHESI